MKTLKNQTADGRTFSPVYLVNDWGVDGWFMGTNYQQTSYGCHSIAMQKDYQITGPFTADALWPDGTIQKTTVVLLRTVSDTVSDHGRSYSVNSPVFGVKKTVGGAEVEVRADKLFFDLQTMEKTSS